MQAELTASYLESIHRALCMPQSRLIPFFGVFIRDLYGIVHDMPNIVVIGSQNRITVCDFIKILNDPSFEIGLQYILLKIL